MPENILSLKDKFDVFIFDIYGVIWDGKAPIAGAMDIMQKLREAGKTVILLSNSTQLAANAEESNMKRGFIKAVHYDKIVTSGDLAYDTFLEDNRKLKFYQFGRRHETLFVKSGYVEVETLDEADFVYIGIPQICEDGVWHDSLTINPFIEELQQIYEMDLPLICANPDLTAHEKEFEEAVVRQGSIASYYDDLGGEVEYFGKPYPLIFDFALQDVDAEDNRILMIGDTLETDILGGNSYGIKTALIEGGIASENMQEEGFDNIEEYANEVGIKPDYIFSKL